MSRSKDQTVMSRETVPFSHDHSIDEVDGDGNGWTSHASWAQDGGHKHRIKGWVIQPAAGHSHTLDRGTLMSQLKSSGKHSQTALKNKVRQKPVDTK